ALDRRRDRGGTAARRVAVLVRLEPRRRPLPDPLVPRRRGARPLRPPAPRDAARHAVALLRRRARAPRGACPTEACPRHRRPASRPRADTDAVDARRWLDGSLAAARGYDAQRRGGARRPAVDA